MPAYLTPGVYVETVDSDATVIGQARVDVCGFTGVCERGPLSVATRLDTWPQYQAVFGGFLRNGLLPHAVKAFFDNGGRTCYVTRVAAPTVQTELTNTPQPADRRSSFVTATTGFVPGAVVTARQGPLVHRYLVSEVDPVAGRITWERQLSPEFTLDGSLVLASGAGAAEAGIPGDDGTECLRVTAASPGSWGEAVRVAVSNTSGTATTTDGGTQSVSRVSSAAGFSAGSVVRVVQAATPGLVTRQIVSFVDPVARTLGWDTPLDNGYDLTEPLVFTEESFDLSVFRSGVGIEVFTALSRHPGHPRFVENVVMAGSNVIRVRSVGSDPSVLPDPAVSGTAIPLRGGRDGIAALRLPDLLGDLGLGRYEQVPEVGLLAVPDLVGEPMPAVVYAPPESPPVDVCLPGPPAPPSPPVSLDPDLVEAAASFSADEVFAGQQRLVAHCEQAADRVALLDPPRLTTVDLLLGWRQRFDSSYAALYAPWVRVLDPMSAHSGALRAIPPSGHVAGVIARVDAARGAAQSPANERLSWAQALDHEITAAEQGILNPAGVNCLRSFAGRGLRVYGARTASSDPALRYLNVRRLLMMIRRALAGALRWTVFEPADTRLRVSLVVAIDSYLRTLWQQGALAGATPEEAFFVRCDEELVAEVGVAVVRPAEFIVFRIGRRENALDLMETGARP